MNNKHTFILGIIVALFCVHAYLFYQVRTVVAQHDVVLNQVVTFINNSQKK